ANASHNFHPYTTGYTSSRYFRNYYTNIVPIGVRETPLSVFTVTRTSNYVSGLSGRITGLDDTSTFAGEPGLSLVGTGNVGAGKFLLRPERSGGDGIDLVHSVAVDLNENTLAYAIIGGADNDEFTVGLNGVEQDNSGVFDPPASITRGDNLTIGYGQKDDGEA
ncbi:MAG: hypothetical protein VW258_12820, partial [Thalassolituus sp.]